MDFVKFDVRERIIRITDSDDRKILPFKNQSYNILKNECLRVGCLFEDPEFPTIDKSMFYSQPIPLGTKWKRPKEICSKPLFIVNEANAHDLDQGYLGNCQCFIEF